MAVVGVQDRGGGRSAETGGAERDRYLSLTDCGQAVAINGRLTVEQAAVVRAALDPLCAPQADDTRNPGQRRADALEEICRLALVRYVLMGIDTTDPAVIEQVRERSTTRDDVTACQLLREHGISPIIGHIVGFGDETWADLRRAGRALAMYDGDYLNAMYATPHSWQRHLDPWQLFAGVKWLELCFHLRPGRLRRLLLDRDRACRREAWWTARHTAMVWLMEVVDFGWHVRFARNPRRLGTAGARGPAAR
jgi:radical SAM superfamily enzyme YgiQ (UPF0313 family)